MGLIEILLIVLLVAVLVGALGPWGANYRGPGLGLAGVVVIILLVVVLT